MGAYLSEPKTEKASSDQDGKHLAYGASSMQGWRMSQEDAHNSCIDFDEDVSLFAVYDGHGGHEVATYCSKYLPDFIKKTEAYQKGDIRQALIDAFLGFDATLASPEVVKILKELVGTKIDEDKEEEEESDVEENINNLCMEASMPLLQVLAKYQAEGANPALKNLNNDGCTSRPSFPSPYLRNRRVKDSGACSSSDAGCSTSSSSSWNTNETDVSSSSQSCSSSSSTHQKVDEGAGSSEVDQVLDSTTSNGDVPHTSQVDSSEDAKPTKSSEMPDSSEDINDEVTPGKVSHTSSTANEAEVNGENSTKSCQEIDTTKVTSENECSSSCTPVENGEADQQEKISSSNRKRNQKLNLYKDLLNKTKDDSDDDSDDDDDDENDETFDGQPESDDDEEDDDNDEEEMDDDEDEDDADDEDDGSMEMNEEPGSDSGCTAVVAVLKGNQLYVANAGDSRCVLCRGGEAVELSLDHKPEDQPEMERIVKAGGKVTADGRVNGGLNLSRALGDHAYKRNKELPAEEQMISALPDIKTATINPEKDEFMVLACDGIWNFMSSQNVINFVRTRINQGHETLSKICEELFDHCLAPNTLGDGTGCDNMTAIIVKFKPTLKQDENTTNEVTSATKKRPVSPNENMEGNECSTDDNNVIDECKRFKTGTETC